MQNIRLCENEVNITRIDAKCEPLYLDDMILFPIVLNNSLKWTIAIIE